MQVFALLHGKKVTLGVDSSFRVEMVKILIAYFFDVSLDMLRIMFEGSTLYLSIARCTLADYHIENGDALDAFIAVSGDIGVFVSPTDIQRLPSGLLLPAPSAPGAQWLMWPTLPPHPTPTPLQLLPSQSPPTSPLPLSDCITPAPCRVVLAF